MKPPICFQLYLERCIVSLHLHIGWAVMIHSTTETTTRLHRFTYLIGFIHVVVSWLALGRCCCAANVEDSHNL